MQYIMDVCHSIYRNAKIMDMQKELYDNHVELSLRFVSKNAHSENLSLEESFSLVASSVILSDNHVFNDKQMETILEASAFLSEKFILTYEGDWLWDENRNMCIIDTKHPTDGKHLYAFLDIILAGWEKSDTKTLLNEFAQMKYHLK